MTMKRRKCLRTIITGQIFQSFPRQTSHEDITITYRQDNIMMRPVSLKELKYVVKNNINFKKPPRYDLITGRVRKELWDKAIMKLLHLINVSLRLTCCPRHWKVAEVIMILKIGKDSTYRKSYRQISPLSNISKLFEKLLLIRLKPIIEERQLIPTHQFGFRNSHSTIH